MPEINAIHIAIIAVLTIVGAIIGWVLRGKRSAQEKAVVNAGWQEQISAQRTEHERLIDQNKALMEQVSQYSASNRDAKNRSKELSLAVQEAYARRDELQREIKDIRSNLEVVMNERQQLQTDMSSQSIDNAALAEKDARIRKLRLELENWQNRLPPLIDKFRERNADAERLEGELAIAHERIADLEAANEAGQTRIEPVRDPDELTDGRDASNEALDDDDIEDQTGIEVQIVVEDDDEDDVEDSDEDDDVPAAINGSRDNLKSIKGVGPAIEKTLNEMGIFRFQQIADMSEYDINRVAKQLKGFRSRIYREDWIGQARELRDQETRG